MPVSASSALFVTGFGVFQTPALCVLYLDGHKERLR